MKITMDDVTRSNPCDDWPRERVERLVGDGIEDVDVLTAPLDDATDGERVWLLIEVARWEAERIVGAIVRAGWSDRRIVDRLWQGWDNDWLVDALFSAGCSGERIDRICGAARLRRRRLGLRPHRRRMGGVRP